MKKSVLFGILTFFAINAVNICSVEAQNPVKKQDTVSNTNLNKEAEKSTKGTTTATSDKKSEPHDCCASHNSDNTNKESAKSDRKMNKKSKKSKSNKIN